MSKQGGPIATVSSNSDIIVEARDLGHWFEATAVLHGVSLSIHTGDIVAITGPSGSGKSTLLHCLSGITVPTSGEVYYRGERLDNRSDNDRSRLRRTEFGTLFQFGQLMPELSAIENVALPLLLAGSRRRPAIEAARQALTELGVESVAIK